MWITTELKSKSKSHYNRQSVGQSVLVSGIHLEPATNFSIFLGFWYVVAPSLTRGRVCLLAVFRQYQSIMSHYLHKIFTLSVFDTVQECTADYALVTSSLGIICCTAPGLKEALYILYLYS
jgi:hypothetical protein